MLSESKYLVDFLVGFLGKKPQTLLFTYIVLPYYMIICKVLLCVGVGLIKKMLSWQQIQCISCSEKMEKYR